MQLHEREAVFIGGVVADEHRHPITEQRPRHQGFDRPPLVQPARARDQQEDGRTSGRSEEHTSELQSLMRISYAVFCLKKKIYTNSTEKTRVIPTTSIK